MQIIDRFIEDVKSLYKIDKISISNRLKGRLFAILDKNDNSLNAIYGVAVCLGESTVDDVEIMRHIISNIKIVAEYYTI